MPPSGLLFAQCAVLLMFVATLGVGGIVRLSGRPASRVMLYMAVIFTLTFPFLFIARQAAAPNYGDVLLGWPLSYAHAQSDAGLASSHWSRFLLDFALGVIVGILYLLFRRRMRAL